jgi:hypothetical protein
MPSPSSLIVKAPIHKRRRVRCNNKLPFQLLEMRSLDKKNNLFEKQEIGQPKSTKESTDERDIPPR